MKSRLRLTIALLVCHCYSLAQETARAIEVPDRGWAAMPWSTSYISASEYWIGAVHTIDGGRSYRSLQFDPPIVYATPAPLLHTRFLPGGAGWIQGRDSIWSTEDGGQTWSKLMEGQFLVKPSFSARGRGWMPVSSRHILSFYVSNDRGKSWRGCGSKANPVFFPRAVAFLGELPVFAIESAFDEKTRVRRFRVSQSSDGGCSWRPIWNQTDPDRLLSTIDFSDRKHGWIGVVDGEDLLHTVDGGVHWSSSKLPPGSCQILDVLAVSEMRAWVEASCPEEENVLWLTGDAGIHWISKSAHEYFALAQTGKERRWDRAKIHLPRR